MTAATKPDAKPTFHLAGPTTGGPTIDDITALYRKLTGREPTPEEMAKAKTILASARVNGDPAKHKAQWLAHARVEHPDMTEAELEAAWTVVAGQLGLE